MSEETKPQRVVWKMELHAGMNEYEMPKGAIILSVGIQRGAAQMWFLCDQTVREKVTRELLLVGTGHEFDADPLKFIGTMMTDDQAYIFHIFEKLSPAAAPIRF